MNTTPDSPFVSAKTTPRDFFLWTGALLALYGTVASFITLLFEYINYVFPDPLAGYGDPYGGAVRFAMATLIVLTPTMLMLFHLIRQTIVDDFTRADIWIRRWGLVLTLFIAGSIVLIDLITLINTFLGGEITNRFILKVAIILLVAFGVSLHFLADRTGYWIANGRKANLVGIAVGLLVLLSVLSGFLIIGTPGELRLLRYDEEKVADLQNIQYQVVDYWQRKQALPQSLNELNDSISGFAVPMDSQTGAAYTYKVTGKNAFSLCATFNLPTRDTRGQGAYMVRDMSYPGFPMEENWQHEAGETCYERTIDPERYPPYPVKPL
jgi:hypothetical protein